MSEEDAIRAASNALMQRGYRLILSPEIDGETRTYRPDIVAVKNGHRLYVEVKAVTSATDASQIERMRDTAEAAGADFALFQYDPEGDIIDVTGIEWPPAGDLHRTEAPVEDTAAVANFILACARCEELLRRIAWIEARREEAVDEAQQRVWGTTPRAEPSPLSREAWPQLVRRLATLGFLESGEYAFLEQAFRVRNRLVHGLEPEPRWNLDQARNDVQQLQVKVAERAERIWRTPS